MDSDVKVVFHHSPQEISDGGAKGIRSSDQGVSQSRFNLDKGCLDTGAFILTKHDEGHCHADDPFLKELEKEIREDVPAMSQVQHSHTVAAHDEIRRGAVEEFRDAAHTILNECKKHPFLLELAFLYELTCEVLGVPKQDMDENFHGNQVKDILSPKSPHERMRALVPTKSFTSPTNSFRKMPDHPCAIEDLRKKAPICDITVLFSGDSVPSGYEKIERSPSGIRADLNKGGRGQFIYLCIKREDSCSRSKRLPISNFAVVLPERGEVVPPGYQMVRRRGCPANLNTGTLGEKVILCYKRSASSSIMDLTVLFPKKGDEVPKGYIRLDKTVLSHPADMNLSSGGTEVYLCYTKQWVNVAKHLILDQVRSRWRASLLTRRTHAKSLNAVSIDAIASISSSSSAPFVDCPTLINECDEVGKRKEKGVDVRQCTERDKKALDKMSVAFSKADTFVYKEDEVFDARELEEEQSFEYEENNDELGLRCIQSIPIMATRTECQYILPILYGCFQQSSAHITRGCIDRIEACLDMGVLDAYCKIVSSTSKTLLDVILETLCDVAENGIQEVYPFITRVLCKAVNRSKEGLHPQTLHRIVDVMFFMYDGVKDVPKFALESIVLELISRLHGHQDVKQQKYSFNNFSNSDSPSQECVRNFAVHYVNDLIGNIYKSLEVARKTENCLTSWKGHLSTHSHMFSKDMHSHAEKMLSSLVECNLYQVIGTLCKIVCMKIREFHGKYALKDIERLEFALFHINTILQTTSTSFQNNPVFQTQIRRFILPSIIECFNVIHPSTIHMVFNVLTNSWKNFKNLLKIEFGIIYEHILIKIMRQLHTFKTSTASVLPSNPSPISYSGLVVVGVEALIYLQKWFALPQHLIELFLNYDLDQHQGDDKHVPTLQQWKIFEQITSQICTIAEGNYQQPYNEQDTKALQCQAFDTILAILRSLMDASGHAHLISRDERTRFYSVDRGGWENEGTLRRSPATSPTSRPSTLSLPSIHFPIDASTMETNAAALGSLVPKTTLVSIDENLFSSCSKVTSFAAPATHHEMSHHANNNMNMNNNKHNIYGAASASGAGGGASASGAASGVASAVASAPGAASASGAASGVASAVASAPGAAASASAAGGGGGGGRHSIRRRNELQKQSQQVLSQTMEIYHSKSSLKKVIEYLVATNVLKEAPAEIAAFLRMYHDYFREVDIGDYLGEGDDELKAHVRLVYVNATSFTGMSLVQAVRHFLTNLGFHLPGEAQKIERLVEAFSQCYWEDNHLRSDAFASSDTIMILAYSIIMLNTDLHNPHVKKNKMSREQFVKNNRGIDNGCDVDSKMLEEIYNDIACQPIQMHSFPLKTKLSSSQEESERDRVQKGLSKAVHQSVELMKGFCHVTKSFHFVGVDTTLSPELIQLLFERIWFSVLTLITSVLSDNRSDLEMMLKCLDMLRYSISICLFLNMQTATQAFATQLAKLRREHILEMGKPTGSTSQDGKSGGNRDEHDSLLHMQEEWFQNIVNLGAVEDPWTVIGDIHVKTTELKACVEKRQTYETLASVMSRINRGHKFLANTKRFIREGDLTKKCRSRNQIYRFFLFNDQLIYADRGLSGKWNIHNSLRLRLTRVGNVNDELLSKNMFKIMNPSKTFVVFAESARVKAEWVRDIKEAIAEANAKTHSNSRRLSFQRQVCTTTDVLLPCHVDGDDDVDDQSEAAILAEHHKALPI